MHNVILHLNTLNGALLQPHKGCKIPALEACCSDPRQGESSPARNCARGNLSKESPPFSRTGLLSPACGEAKEPV